MLRQRILSCLKDRSRVSLSNLGQEIPKAVRGGRSIRELVADLDDFVFEEEGDPPYLCVSLKPGSGRQDVGQAQGSGGRLLTPAQLLEDFAARSTSR